MKLNKFLFCILLSCLVLPVIAQEQTEDQALEEQFISQRAELGESHASGGRPDLGPVIIGNPAEAHTVIRVGLSFSTLNSSGAIVNEFATRHFSVVQVSHTVGTVHLIDESTGKLAADLDVPGTIVTATRDTEGYHLSIGGVEIGTFAGPLLFQPTDPTNQFRIENIRRSFSGTKVPLYRGEIELADGSGTPANTLDVVNIIEIEDYVPGVVANESIASFAIEALKAQAVASRGYAIANIGRFRASFPYDIVDSTTSQVYRGVISEHPRAVQASQETAGLVASYQGQIISALYSSSMGGHTEYNEWIFNSPSNQLPGTNGVPYLQGIYDGDGTPPDFTTEAGVSAFWAITAASDTYDDCTRSGNSFSRWRFTLTQSQLRAKVPSAITGTITNVEITERMPSSGRAAIVKITTSSGQTYTITGWDPLRAFFRPAATTPRLCGTGTIAANFTLNNPSVIIVNRNADDSLNNITVWGGGWGHNVGMSQYGANGRGKAGQTFLQILKAYYTGVDIGSYPIDIGRNPGSGPPLLRQSFYAANAVGTLVVRPTGGLKALNVTINGTTSFHLTADQLSQPVISIDISPYLTAGLNTVQYNPVGRNGGATVNVNVE
jgi:SpoIID/LytB domain protein